MSDWLPADWAARLMEMAWQALDWRMALSPRDALMAACALMAVEAFGIVSLISAALAASEREA